MIKVPGASMDVTAWVGQEDLEVVVEGWVHLGIRTPDVVVQVGCLGNKGMWVKIMIKKITSIAEKISKPITNLWNLVHSS